MPTRWAGWFAQSGSGYPQTAPAWGRSNPRFGCSPRQGRAAMPQCPIQTALVSPSGMITIPKEMLFEKTISFLLGCSEITYTSKRTDFIV